MKKKILIFILIIMLIVILGIVIFYVINSFRKVQVYKGKIPILITSEENDKIMEFYNKTEKEPLKSNEMVSLAIMGEVMLKFNDGNTLSLDENPTNYAYLKNEKQEYLIRISSEFHNYIFSIVK